MCAGSLSKCCGFITLSASVISPSVDRVNRPLTVREMSIYLLKSSIQQSWAKGKSDPGLYHHQKLISSCDHTRPTDRPSCDLWSGTVADQRREFDDDSWAANEVRNKQSYRHRRPKTTSHLTVRSTAAAAAISCPHGRIAAATRTQHCVWVHSNQLSTRTDCGRYTDAALCVGRPTQISVHMYATSYIQA